MSQTQRNFQLFIDTGKTVDISAPFAPTLWFDTLNFTFSPPLTYDESQIRDAVREMLRNFRLVPFQNLVSGENDVPQAAELWRAVQDRLGNWNINEVFEYNNRISVRIVPLADR